MRAVAAESVTSATERPRVGRFDGWVVLLGTDVGAEDGRDVGTDVQLPPVESTPPFVVGGTVGGVELTTLRLVVAVEPANPDAPA